MTTQTCHEASLTLLAQAELELAADDLRQASEEGWGAAAQVVKAVAEQRGWPHRNHASLYRTVARLTAELDDPEINRLYQLANALHANFYENWQSKENVELSLVDINRFVHRLSALL